MKLNEKIIKLRGKNNLSQQDLADKVFVSRQAVQKWEKGKAVPSIDILKQLSTIFNVTIDWLVNDEEPLEETKVEEPNIVKEEKNSPINNNKKHKRGLKIALAITIPCLVVGGIGGGIAAYIGIKAEEKRQYEETFGTDVRNADFDIKTQLIPDVDNAVIQITPKYDVINASCTVDISPNLLPIYQDRRELGDIKANKTITLEYSKEEISTELRDISPTQIFVSCRGKKQNKYKNSVSPVVDENYADIKAQLKYYETDYMNPVRIYITSNYDGLLFAGEDLTMTFKHGDKTITASSVRFKTNEPNYLKKGDTIEVQRPFNLQYNFQKFRDDPIMFSLVSVTAGKLIRGPKKEETILHANTEDAKEICFDDFCGDSITFTYEYSFWSMFPVANYKNIRLKIYKDKVLKFEKFMDVAQNFYDCGDYLYCMDVVLSEEEYNLVAGLGEIQVESSGDLILDYKIQGASSITYKYMSYGNQLSSSYYTYLPGYPMTLPRTLTFENKSIRGYYTDENLTTLVDFSKTIEFGNYIYYAKVE